jgi:hypothetical protein
MVRLDGQTLLLEMVRTLHPTRSLPSRLHGRQQQSNQYPNDGNDHQELDQREPLLVFKISKLAIHHECNPPQNLSNRIMQYA